MGDVKWSAGGGFISTSWNGYSNTKRTRVWHALASDSIFLTGMLYSDNCSCPIEQHSWTMAVIRLSCARKEKVSKYWTGEHGGGRGS